MVLKKTTCPLCRKRYTNILQHMAIAHEIQGTDDLRAEIEILERKKRKQQEFSEFVDLLKAQMAKGTISAEEYRMHVTRWFEEHRLDLRRN